MIFRANLKIRDKLVFGFSAVVLMALAIGVFGYFQILSLERVDNLLFKKGVKPLEHIGSIAGDFQRLRVNIREYILASDHSKHEHYLDLVTKFRNEIDSTVAKLETELPDAEAKKLFAWLVESRRSFTPHINKVMELARSNRDNEAISYLNSDANVAAERAEMDAIENLQQHLVANAEKISESNSETALNSGMILLCMAFGASLLATIMTILITRGITNPLALVLDAVRSQQEVSRKKARLVEAIAGGDLNHEAIITEPIRIEREAAGRDETGILLNAIVGMSEIQYVLDQAFADMTDSLRHNREQEERRNWFRNGQHELNTILRGEKSAGELARQSLTFLAEYLGAGVGVFYLYDEHENMLRNIACYAVSRPEYLHERIGLGEGLAGQAALEKRIIRLNAAPPDYLRICSGLGESEPADVIALPLLHHNNLTGLVEIGSFAPLNEREIEFLNLSMEPLAIAISVARSRHQVNDLLQQAQSQTEELRVQQEELQQTNEELEERAQLLELQREEIRAKNREVEETSRELRSKAIELERVSSYKSEFLANMSHELRTPLNSLMILSGLLRDNREGNLSLKQVEFADTINSAGRDLLNLINDILDLSKIEAGHLELQIEKLALSEICARLETTFDPIAREKGINFSVLLEDSAPNIITTDDQRVRQILKNLLSNACKFTSHGGVSLRIYTPDAAESPLAAATTAFAVSDTGIGIPLDKQSIIFNAFQQADGSTSRMYGGTGLGLSISSQLARSMGGDISLKSEPGSGSTFTLYLPVGGEHCPVPAALHAGSPASPAMSFAISAPQQKPDSALPKDKLVDPLPAPIPDNRDTLRNGDRSILIIEDDLPFARILADVVRGRNFSVLVAADGESGITLAECYQPSAIILDVMLPRLDGWGVMRSLKDNPVTRHIPVHFITCLEERRKAMSMGAIGLVTKPVSSDQLDTVFSNLESAIEKTMKMLLIVEDDQEQARAMVSLLEVRNVTITVADSSKKAIEFLSSERFDCIVLDLGLADMGAFELLDELKSFDPERNIPVIIHTGSELTHDEEKRLHHYAESIIIKGAKSPERLLNEVTLFLHLVESSLDSGKQHMIRSSLDKEAMLEGKKILIVDDDMRNIFSLSSALAEKNITVFEAENGREALHQLDAVPDMDLILMDIMMPEMDGYEAMRTIRKDPRFATLPIIALTAKAMRGDREECMGAGASDYIPKPVDMGKLFSLLRVWLYPSASTDLNDIDIPCSMKVTPE